MNRPNVVLGVALGGGGVRGLAHLGVLRALERASLLPDVISGTSIGAITAAAVASGSSVDELIETALALRWNQLLRFSPRRDCLFETAGLSDFLATIITAGSFDDLQMSCAAVARDHVTGERVVLRDGDPRRAAFASAAVRRVFPPVEVDGRQLCDGAGVDRVPVAVARELGADYVIGVDVVREPSMRRLRTESGVASRELDANTPDLMIRPVLRGRAAWDFTLASELIELGEAAAEKVIPAISAAVAA